MNKVKQMAKSRKVLKTDADVIAAYGGTARTARRWDVSQAAVSQWRITGVPPGHHYRMSKDLEGNGFIVDGQSLGWI